MPDGQTTGKPDAAPPSQEKQRLGKDFMIGWLLDVARKIAPTSVPNATDSQAEQLGGMYHSELSRLGRAAGGQFVPGIGYIDSASRVVGTIVDAIASGKVTAEHAENLTKVILPAAAAAGINPWAGFLIAEELMFLTAKKPDGSPLFPGMTEEERFFDWYKYHGQ